MGEIYITQARCACPSLARGIKPRIGSERRIARRSAGVYLHGQVITLAILTIVVFLIAGN